MKILFFGWVRYQKKLKNFWQVVLTQIRNYLIKIVFENNELIYRSDFYHF